MAENMRVFHVTKRAEDGKWTVKEEKTDDVLHTFDTREDATRYCEVFAEEKDALIKYHASKGKNKGRIIEVYNSRTMDPKEFAKLMEKYEAENDALTDEDIIITAMGYDAVVLQHEYDHLDGIFYYDRINANNPEGKMPGEEII